MTSATQQTTPLCFIDTETTSLHRQTRLAWDVAMVRIEPDGRRTATDFLIAPIDLSEADPASLNIGRFYDRYPANSMTEARAARTIEAETRGAILLGGNPAFDDLHLDRLLRRHQLVPAWHYHPWDVTAYAAGALGVPPGSGLKSDDIARLLGVDPDDYDRHTAKGDVDFFIAQYEAVLALRATRLEEASTG